MASTTQVLNQADIKSSLINQYIVTPLINLGIAGFVFDIIEEHKIELKSEITDHYVEDNSTIQDHIALAPKRFTLKGFIGELVEYRGETKSSVVNLAEKLVLINSYIPVITGAARQIQNQITTNKLSNKDDFNSAFGSAVDIYQIFKTLNPPKTKQAKAFNFFQALWQAKQLVAIDTPFGYLSNMAIEEITPTQGNNAYITDFSITLKEFRTVSTKLVDFDDKNYQGRATDQKAKEVDKGTTKGTLRNVSFIKDQTNKAGITEPKFK
jgi:hypothetical protein